MRSFRAGIALCVGIICIGLSAMHRSDSSLGIGPAVAASKAKAKAPQPKQALRQLPPRTPFTEEDEAIGVIPDIPEARIWGDSAAAFKRALPTVQGPWLSMSGGGADGAFAAGVLAGWTSSGQRPEFALVTGSSIGALLSPYAFLGSRYDGELRDAITTITAADIFEDRPTAESFLDSWPLKELIAKRVTATLLADIAAEHQRGRRLFTVTTDVDNGRRVVWNMGAIAQRGDDKALSLFRDVLLASASIPGFFPPVFINVDANGRTFQEMHLDGSILSPFFVAPESLLSGNAGTLPATDLYIIANSRLKPDFEQPGRNNVAILGRLIGVVLKAGLRAELLLIADNAQKLGVNPKLAIVSNTFAQPSRGLFDPAYMRALFDYGMGRGSKGTAFEPLAAVLAQDLSEQRP